MPRVDGRANRQKIIDAMPGTQKEIADRTGLAIKIVRHMPAPATREPWLQLLGLDSKSSNQRRVLDQIRLQYV